MRALVYRGPGQKAWEEVPAAAIRIPAEKMGTHSFTFDQMDDAYDVFSNAAANSALKVIITPA